MPADFLGGFAVLYLCAVENFAVPWVYGDPESGEVDRYA